MNMALRVRVTGRVQGVWFRGWTREQAIALGITGWVRNSADGAVVAHVEGAEPIVEQMIERLRRGPPAATVDAVEVFAVERGDFRSFDVRR